nr:unnamed protein product [Callosobruchus chinensis]CAH7750986.1 unnamed protein product [Callosobruchus chinensis]
MLIIPRINTFTNIAKFQSYSKNLFGRTVLNDYLSESRTIRNYTKLRSTYSKRTIQNTRKAIGSHGYSTIVVLGGATLSAKLFQMMKEAKCDAPKNPFKTADDPENIIRKSLTALVVTGIIAAVNWLTWGVLSNPVLGLIVIFAGVYYEIDRQEKEKLTIRIKL